MTHFEKGKIVVEIWSNEPLQDWVLAMHGASRMWAYMMQADVVDDGLRYEIGNLGRFLEALANLDVDRAGGAARAV